MRGPNYYWRLMATGACFATFGVGGLVLSTLVFPVALLFSGSRRLSTARWLIHKSFAAFIGLMECAGIMRFEVVGRERLRNCRNTLVLANHPTLIDVVALVSLIPNANCVVKRSLWNNPLLGGTVRAACYISNIDAVGAVDDCAEALATGDPLIIFPEGTRTRPGEALKFLRGAAHMALKSNLPIVPVVIRCTPSTLSKRERWYQIPCRRFHLQLHVLPPVHASQWVRADEPQSLAARRLTSALEEFFTFNLNQNAATQT